MKTPRHAFRRDRQVAFAGLLGLAVLVAGYNPPAALASEEHPAVSNERIDDICAGELSYDVTGPYFYSCRNYLRGHVRARAVAAHADEPAEHRACEQIGLARDTPEWRRCVQELYQLDISADHL